MEIDGITEEVSVTDCDLSRSVFRDVRLDDTVFDDVSFARAKFSNIDFSNAVLLDCNLSGLTIDGVALSDLWAAYRKHS